MGRRGARELWLLYGDDWRRYMPFRWRWSRWWRLHWAELLIVTTTLGGPFALAWWVSR